MDERGLLEGHAGRRGRRVRPQPAEGRQHLGQRQQRRRPRPLAVLLHGRPRRRRHPPRARPRPVRQDRLGPARPTRSIPASCWPRSTTPSASTRPRSSTTTSTSPASWSRPTRQPAVCLRSSLENAYLFRGVLSLTDSRLGGFFFIGDCPRPTNPLLARSARSRRATVAWGNRSNRKSLAAARPLQPSHGRRLPRWPRMPAGSAS